MGKVRRGRAGWKCEVGKGRPERGRKKRNCGKRWQERLVRKGLVGKERWEIEAGRARGKGLTCSSVKSLKQ